MRSQICIHHPEREYKTKTDRGKESIAADRIDPAQGNAPKRQITRYHRDRKGRRFGFPGRAATRDHYKPLAQSRWVLLGVFPGTPSEEGKPCFGVRKATSRLCEPADPNPAAVRDVP